MKNICFLNKNFFHFQKSRCNLGQSVVEYSMILGVIIAVFIVLSPMVKLGTQSMVKIVADEVGYQQNSEQKDLDAGLLNTTTTMAVDQERRREEWRTGIVHSIQASYNEQTIVNASTKSSLGVR